MKVILEDKTEIVKGKVIQYVKERLRGFNPSVEFSEEEEKGKFIVSITNTEADSKIHDEFWDKFEEVFNGEEDDEEVTQIILLDIYKEKICGLMRVSSMYSKGNILIFA